MPVILRTSLQKRFVSALVLGPFALFVVWNGGWFFTLLLLMITGLALYEWVLLALKTPRPILSLVLGIFYILLSFWCCYLIRMDLGWFKALLFLLMIWASDIGAYFSGKIIGGPKMATQVSPKKTWAGYVGALVFPALAGIIAMWGYEVFVVDGFSITWFFVAFWFVCGVLIGIVGQSGDLLVSYLKRLAHVKDTGDLIPGHGGFLDRADSLMLAAPVFLYLVREWGQIYGS